MLIYTTLTAAVSLHHCRESAKVLDARQLQLSPCDRHRRLGGDHRLWLTLSVRVLGPNRGPRPGAGAFENLGEHTGARRFPGERATLYASRIFRRADAGAEMQGHLPVFGRATARTPDQHLNGAGPVLRRGARY